MQLRDGCNDGSLTSSQELRCAVQRLRDLNVRGAAIVGEKHGELEADLSISDLRHVPVHVSWPAVSAADTVCSVTMWYRACQSLVLNDFADAELGCAGRYNISI